MNPALESPIWRTRHRIGLAVLLTVWFGAAYYIGAAHLLVNSQGQFMAPIAVTAVVPVALFLAFYALSPRFRVLILSPDISQLTVLQHWRVVGFAFLPLYAYDVLPGLFAWPAGLGDVAIGIAAAFVCARLRRDPEYVQSSGFLWFNLLGLLDLAVAMAMAGLSAGQFPALIDTGITSAAMNVWPLNIFPSFFVPIFIILHLTVLLKRRQMRRANPATGRRDPQPA